MQNPTDDFSFQQYAELINSVYELHHNHGGHGLDCLLTCAELLLESAQNRAIERRAQFRVIEGGE